MSLLRVLYRCQHLKRFCFVRERIYAGRQTSPNLHEHISAFCVFFFTTIGGKIFVQFTNIIYLTKLNVHKHVFVWPTQYLCPGLRKGFPFSWEKIIRGGSPTLSNLGEHFWQKLNHILASWPKNICSCWTKYFRCRKQIFPLLRKSYSWSG